MLQFDPQTGLSAPSTAEIRQQVQEDWQAAFQQSGVPPLNVEPETPAGQLIDSETAIIADKNAEVLYLANMFNPRTAQGIWQAALGQIYFITPKQAQASVAECTCTGLAGTLIPAGSLIQSTVDQTQWAALSDGRAGLSPVRLSDRGAGDGGSRSADADCNRHSRMGYREQSGRGRDGLRR